MSEKKRKRASEHSGQPPKKHAGPQLATNVKVSVLDGSKDFQPIIACAPGLEPVSNTPLDVYIKPRPLSERGLLKSDLLLHSSDHSKLDYTIQEETSGTADDLLKHYVGVYDPATGALQVVEARKAVLRATLRSAADGELGTEDDAPKTALAARTILGQAFGTKKSQKSIRSLTENAITAQDGPDGKPKIGASAAAVLETMAQSSSSMPTREELQALTDEAKPRPTANLVAENPEDVYTLDSLVGQDLLRALDIKPWKEAVKKKEDVKTTSQFVSRRLFSVVKSEDSKKIKGLKYLLALIQWHRCLKRAGKDTKKLPPREDVVKAVPDVDGLVLERIRKKFAPNMELNRWDVDFLLTHICALAVVLDTNYETDIYYLQADVGTDLKQLSTYFMEIGCRVNPLSQGDMKKAGITSAAIAATHKMARLKIPLQFPKIRLPMRRR